MLFLQSLGVGVPLLDPISSQGSFGERVGSAEKHLPEQHPADLFPASSRGVQQEANELPQQHRSGQAVPVSTS